MKTSFTIIVAILAVALSASAQTSYGDRTTVFGLGATNNATTLANVIVPNKSSNDGTPVVTYISYGSDLATSGIQFYKCTAITQAAYSTNVTVTLSVNQTNGFSSGDVILIKHVTAGSESYEKRTLTTMTAATNLITTVAPAQVVTPGDIIYRVTTTGIGKIPVGIATNNISASLIYAGQKNIPLLVEITGTTSCQLPVVSGYYAP